MTAWSTAYGAVPHTLPPKQPFWDRPGVLADRVIVESGLTTPFHRTSFLAASSPHSGDWLFAMPITSCGLRLDDAAVRVGVGLRLGLSLCVPHQCQCGSLVSSTGIHSFVCKKAPGRTARPHALNDLIARTLVSAGIPTKEPNCMSRSDGKRPDGLTLVPRKEGKHITWDSTVVCTVVDSYVSGSAREAGLAGKTAAQRKEAKYRGQATLQGTHLFQQLLWCRWKRRLRHFWPSWATGSRH